jgi:hypothetical protein
MHGEKNLFFSLIVTSIPNVRERDRDIEGSILKTNITPIKLDVAIVRRANVRETSRFLMVDKKLLNDNNPSVVFNS